MSEYVCEVVVEVRILAAFLKLHEDGLLIYPWLQVLMQQLADLPYPILIRLPTSHDDGAFYKLSQMLPKPVVALTCIPWP